MRTTISAGLLAAGLLTPCTQAQEAAKPSIEQRLERMERELEQLRQENLELKRELGAGAKAPAAVTVTALGKEASLKLGGLVQAQADFGDKGDSRFATGNDRFYLRRARLNASGTFLEHFDFKLELELSGTLGETSGLRAQGTDLYAQWTAYQEASVRMGQFKTPYGFEQLFADPNLFSIERTLGNDRLTFGRQLGAQVFGAFFDKRLSYAAGMFNGTGINNGFNDSDNFLTAGRLSGVPWRGKLGSQETSWGLGVNGYYSDDVSVSGLNDFGFDSTPATPAEDNVFAGIRKGIGVDTQVQVGPVEVWAEYLRSQFEPSNALPDSRLDGQSWYVQGACYFVPKRLQAVVKFDTFDPDTDVSGNSTDTWTFGLNYYIKGHDLKLQLNYLLVDAPGFDHWQSKVLARAQVIF